MREPQLWFQLAAFGSSWLFKGDINRAPFKGDVDVEVDMNKDGSFGC